MYGFAAGVLIGFDIQAVGVHIADDEGTAVLGQVPVHCVAGNEILAVQRFILKRDIRY